MSAPQTFSWDRPTVEPVQRMCAGRFGFVGHRFPIKGGITPMKAHAITMQQSLNKPSTLFKALVREGAQP